MADIRKPLLYMGVAAVSLFCIARTNLLFAEPPKAGVSKMTDGNMQARLNAPTRQQNFVIRVGERGVEPSDIVVIAESTVVWRNTTGGEIRIEFLGRGPAVTCNEPVGFELSASGLSVSERLHPGDVASVCFVEPRQYSYRVTDAHSNARLGEGTIKVTKTY